jgi:hypothetical protein
MINLRNLDSIFVDRFKSRLVGIFSNVQNLLRDLTILSHPTLEAEFPINLCIFMDWAFAGLLIGLPTAIPDV